MGHIQDNKCMFPDLCKFYPGFQGFFRINTEFYENYTNFLVVSDRRTLGYGHRRPPDG